MRPQNPPYTTIMTKRNFRPKVLVDPVPVGKNIGYHGNTQQTMKRQRPIPAGPGFFSNGGNGRPARLQPRVENDGHGEEEPSGSVERKISKIRRQGDDDDSVQILYRETNTGKVSERNPKMNKRKDSGKIAIYPIEFTPKSKLLHVLTIFQAKAKTPKLTCFSR